MKNLIISILAVIAGVIMSYVGVWFINHSGWYNQLSGMWSILATIALLVFGLAGISMNIDK